MILGNDSSEPFLIVDDGMCFACGVKNPKGLNLRFTVYPQKRRIETRLIPSSEFQGWKGIVHGGIIATILDELMAKIAHEMGFKAVTATLEIRFRNFALVSEELFAFGEILRIEKRIIYAQAQALKTDGTIIAEASAKLLKT